MKRRTRVSLLAAALLIGLAWSAHAGLKDSNSGGVNITTYSDGSGYTWAHMGAVRASSDGSAFMGCYASGYGTVTRYVVCKARNSSGKTVNCAIGGVSNNVVVSQPYIDVWATVSPDSVVEFDWDANGKCTYLNVLTDSSIRPKTL
jgi:hypothetical protein